MCYVMTYSIQNFYKVKELLRELGKNHFSYTPKEEQNLNLKWSAQSFIGRHPKYSKWKQSSHEISQIHY